MADVKITALPASAGLVAADLIPVVDDVAGTPVTQKATLTQLIAFLDANHGITANTQTGTTYTLVLADAGKVVEMNNASANTLTVPPNSSVAFPVGTLIEVYNMGAGVTTVAAGSGVTVRNAGALSAQYATASLRKRATDEWVLTGSLA